MSAAHGLPSLSEFLKTKCILPSCQALVHGQAPNFLSPYGYDPVADRWSLTGSLTFPRKAHIAALLPTGKVLVAGGYRNLINNTEYASVELFEPKSGQWTEGPTMNQAAVPVCGYKRQPGHRYRGCSRAEL